MTFQSGFITLIDMKKIIKKVKINCILALKIPEKIPDSLDI